MGLAVFVITALIALGVVSAGTVLISERIARSNAVTDAERTAVRVTESLVGPPLRETVRTGDVESFEALDRAVDHRMSDGSITHINVWAADGLIFYSSDEALAGRTVPPTPELRAAIAGEVVSSVDENPELPAPGGAADEPEVEVYVPLEIEGTPYAVETHFTADSISREAEVLRGEMIPLAVGALLVLQLIQLPIAIGLVHRIRRQDAEQASLLTRALAASERERRAIAADVHDGPVQDLAGISFALEGLRSSVRPERQRTVDRLIEAVRDAVHSLRRMMVDIYPPDLGGSGLELAMEDLVAPLRDDGLTVTLSTADLPPLDPETSAALYRTAKEALANTAEHAEASHVWLSLVAEPDHGRPSVRLEVADDGVGFPTTGIDKRTEGHLGLRLVRDRITDLGGTVELGARPGGGAALSVVVPAIPPG